MSTFDGHYTIEDLLALRESPLVIKPDGLPQMEQWMQPAMERRNVSNSQSHIGNGESSEVKYRSADTRRSRGDSIVLGPPQMSFASSLHSPPLRKSSNKEPTMPTLRNRPSPPHDESALSTSPPEEEEEPGWSKVRSTTRGSAVRAFDRDRRGGRPDRRVPRESFGEGGSQRTSFRSAREGESDNWRNDRPPRPPRNTDPMRNDRREDGDSLEGEDDFGGGGGGGGGEHSAEEFQAWIAKMRGKPVDTGNETQDDTPIGDGPPAEPPKNEKTKIVDVDSLFALDAPVLDEGASTAPASSVFFDSVPTAGRASRFRQLFAQEPPAQPAPLDSRPSVDRSASNPVFTSAPKPTASAEDREGFQRIMAMLGGGGGSGKPAMPFMDKSPPMQPPAQLPMQNGPAQGESKTDFFQRLLRQGQSGGPNPLPYPGPPMPVNPRHNPPMDQSRPPPIDLDPRMGRPPQQSQHPRSPPTQSDPRFPPFDLPPPPQGGPWMGPPPGFSPPNSRYAYPGPPLSPALPPPPAPPGGFSPPPPGMIHFGGPPPGFGRGVFSPPLPPPGQDGWHGPPGFGFYQEGEGRDR